MKYTILYDALPQPLANSVNEHIELGWMPVGGLALGINSYEREVGVVESVVSTQLFAQAMVLPEEGKQKSSERRILTGRFNG